MATNARGTSSPLGSSDSSRRTAVARTTLGLLVATLAGGVLAIALAMRALTLVMGSPVRTVDSVVEAAVCGVGALVAAWLAASALLALGCLSMRLVGSSWRSGERIVHRYAPVVVRRALVLVIGASVGLGVATGASAAVAPGPTPSPTSSSVAVDDFGWEATIPVDTAGAAGPTAVPTAVAPTDVSSVEPSTAPVHPTPGPTPPALVVPAAVASAASAPAASAPAAAPAVAPPARPAPEDVVVVAGDSLWAIAARHLTPDATDAEIAASWPQWYRANATLIGPDPGRIVPGQVLAVPASLGGARS